MFGLHGRELRFAAVISTAHLTQHLLMRLVPPLIPILAVGLEYPLWQLGLFVSVYMLGGGLAQAPIGVLSDRYDRLYILPTGLAVGGLSYVLFAAGPAIGSVVPSLSAAGHTFEGGFLVMSLAMLGVGLGAAVVHPTAYPLISANVGESSKGTVLGMFGGLAKVGDATAPTVVGVLIVVLVWEQIVVLLGLATAGIGALLFLALRGGGFETAPGRATDGAAATTVDPADEDAEPELQEDRSPAEGTDNRSYLYPLAVIYCFFVTKMFAGNGVNSFLPVFVVGVYAYAVEVGGVSLGPESVANFYFTALLLAAAASQLLVGRLTDRYDPRLVILGCLAVGTAAIVVLATVDLPPPALLVVVITIGGALWGTNPPRDALVSDIAPPDREGRTFGYLWTAVQLTGATIPVLVGYTIEAVGYREGFLVLSLGGVLAFLCVSLLFVDRVYEGPSAAVRGAEADPSD